MKWHVSSKRDNFELFQRYNHFKRHLGPKRIDVVVDFCTILESYNNSIRDKIYDKKTNVSIFADLFNPPATLTKNNRRVSKHK